MPAVIKAGQLSPEFEPSLRTLDLHDHIVQADKIVKEAQGKVKAMLDSAMQEAKVLREEAQRKGYEEGFQKGNNEGLSAGHTQGLQEAKLQFDTEQKQLCSTLQTLVMELENRKRDLLIDAGQDMLLLATTVAEKVTKSAIEADPDSASSNLREVIHLVGTQTDLTVHIHPKDGETVRRFAEGMKTQLDQQTHFSVIEDDSITPGGCLVKTDKSEIDATVETQIDQIVTLLIGRPLSKQEPEEGTNGV